MSQQIPNYVVNQINALSYETLLKHNVIKIAEDGKSITCPACGNGTGEDGTGIQPYFNGNAWLYHCFRCGASFNNIKLLSLHYGLDSKSQFKELCQKIAQDFGIHYEAEPSTPATNAPKKKNTKPTHLKNSNVKNSAPAQVAKIEPPHFHIKESNSQSNLEDKQNSLMIEMIRDDIVTARENLQDLLNCNSRSREHLQFQYEMKRIYYVPLSRELEKIDKKNKIRGLTLETLQHWGCGFILDWIPVPQRIAGNKIATPSPRLIIPSGDHYLARLCPEIKDKLELRSYPKNTKYITPKQHIGKKLPFGFDTINPSSINIVVEGEIDAMSIYQLTNNAFPVIATSGTTGYEKFIEMLTEKFATQKKPPCFIVIYDSDKAGREAAPKFVDALKAEGFPAVSYFLFNTESKIDANELLTTEMMPDPDDMEIGWETPGWEILQDKLNIICNKAVPELFQMQSQFIKDAAINEQLAFIADPNVRRDFIKLRRQTPSDERNQAMIQIIKDNLEWKVDAKGHRKYILPTAQNFRLIFYHDPVLEGLFAFEEFNGATVILKKPYWRKEIDITRQWKDSDDAALRIHIRENYTDLCSRLTTDDIFSVIAQENSFNIVKQHLESLPTWDGVERAETLFINHLKIPDTEYARQVTFKWLLAAVARIYHPGCNFQAALVLQGNQNIGKSYILEKLGGAWHGSLIDDVDDPHAIDAIRQIWICEMKEFSAARKAEINAVKSFIERPIDTYRAAYARRAQNYPRHCVFSITVNDKQFLRDLTGNRRYWILESPLKEFEIVHGITDEYIQQVWAEVVHKFKQMMQPKFNDKLLELPLEYKHQAEEIAAEFTADDGLQTEIEEFLDIEIPHPLLWKLLTKEERRKFFTQKSITLTLSDWEMRRRTLPYYEKNEIDDALRETTYTKWMTPQDSSKPITVTVYGKRRRNEVCAVEIYHEFFSGGDKRKQIYRINEVLSKIPNWKKVQVQHRDFNGYGNQKRYYCRVIP